MKRSAAETKRTGQPRCMQRDDSAMKRPPPTWTARLMARRRVTVSPSNVPGMSRSDVYLDLGGVRRGAGTGCANDIDPDAATGRSLDRSRTPPRGLRALVARCRTIADRAHPGVPYRGRPFGVALGVRLGGERDHVGQLADRLEVAEIGPPGQPERGHAI